MFDLESDACPCRLPPPSSVPGTAREHSPNSPPELVAIQPGARECRDSCVYRDRHEVTHTRQANRDLTDEITGLRDDLDAARRALRQMIKNNALDAPEPSLR